MKGQISLEVLNWVTVVVIIGSLISVFLLGLYLTNSSHIINITNFNDLENYTALTSNTAIFVFTSPLPSNTFNFTISKNGNLETFSYIVTMNSRGNYGNYIKFVRELSTDNMNFTGSSPCYIGYQNSGKYYVMALSSSGSC
jgi:hypothetical protein